MPTVSGFTKEGLINHLENNTKVLWSRELKDAFYAIDRKDFVPKEYSNEAYEDYPLPIGYGQTISQPTTVAFMLELLAPKKREKILDIGTGSGWTTALLSHIVGSEGEVFGVEIIPELVELGRKNIEKYNFKHTKILLADSEKIGYSIEAPFDKILVSASAESMPEELIEQLKDGGIMVIPIKDSVWQIKKIGNKINIKKFIGFTFVPLVV